MAYRSTQYFTLLLTNKNTYVYTLWTTHTYIYTYIHRQTFILFILKSTGKNNVPSTQLTACHASLTDYKTSINANTTTITISAITITFTKTADFLPIQCNEINIQTTVSQLASQPTNHPTIQISKPNTMPSIRTVLSWTELNRTELNYIQNKTKTKTKIKTKQKKKWWLRPTMSRVESIQFEASLVGEVNLFTNGR